MCLLDLLRGVGPTVLPLKKYVPAQLSRTQTCKTMLRPRNKPSELSEAQSWKKWIYLWRTCHNIYKRTVTVKSTIQYTQKVRNLRLQFVDQQKTFHVTCFLKMRIVKKLMFYYYHYYYYYYYHHYYYYHYYYCFY